MPGKSPRDVKRLEALVAQGDKPLRIDLRLPPSLLLRVEAHLALFPRRTCCKARGVSRTDLVRDALERVLETT